MSKEITFITSVEVHGKAGFKLFCRFCYFGNMKKQFLVFLFVSSVCFGQEKNYNYIIEGSIFKISYNEQYEQPNWIEYRVRNIKKKFNRKGLNFYNVDSVYTSNNYDYKNNIWDKGHLAPAASFSDTEANLKATFSFLNCVLQHNNLNRYEWAQLEAQVRDWASYYKEDIEVRVDIIFDYGHQILSTGAHVPSAFRKTLKFANGTKKCFYFPNSPTNGKDWTEFEISCN